MLILMVTLVMTVVGGSGWISVVKGIYSNGIGVSFSDDGDDNGCTCGDDDCSGGFGMVVTMGGFGRCGFKEVVAVAVVLMAVIINLATVVQLVGVAVIVVVLVVVGVVTVVMAAVVVVTLRRITDDGGDYGPRRRWIIAFEDLQFLRDC